MASISPGISNRNLVNGTNRPEYPIYCICARMAGLRYGGKDLDELMRRLTSDEVKKRARAGPFATPEDVSAARLSCA